MQAFNVGDRVRVGAEYHWARLAAGRISLPPTPVTNLAAGWDGPYRPVTMLKGVVPFYWVEFDVPQVDADGDGPYQAGEIEVTYLSRL